MVRLALLAAAAGAVALAGCAGTWDTVSSQKFRDAPFKTLFTADDPMTVLRTRVEGNDRADAMRRLKEPSQNGKSAQEQDEALQVLATAATADPSPVIRTAAVDALGRFRDPRAVNILIAAYHKADDMPSDPAKTTDPLQPAGARIDSVESLAALGPVGFEPAFVSTVRSRTVTALAQTNQPEAVRFLANVAAGGEKKSADGPDTSDRDVRSAAVRGLGQMRSKEAVAALARVLKDEAGRDVVLASNAHAGLKELTGKDLPADPAKWDQVVQAGVEVTPEPNLIQRAVGWATK